MTGVPHLVAAPDKFRGTASAAEIAGAACAAAELAGWTTAAVPLADGGEGTLEAVGGAERHDLITGPLGALVDAEWRLVEAPAASTAVIEMARASGMALVGPATANDPVGATTRGTGELLAAALRAGARRVVIGCGGSATTDGGSGMIDGLGDLAEPGMLDGIELLVACDVTTAFLDAPSVFGPQKGATPDQIVVLRARLATLAAKYRDRYGVDVTTIRGAGAAGGLAGGLAALGGTIVSGFDLVADLVGLDRHLDEADLVVTGEGCLDMTSLSGKVVSGVLSRLGGRCRVLVVAGTTDRVGAGELAAATGTPEELVKIVDLVERFGRERSMGETAELVREVVGQEVGSSLRWTGEHLSG